MAEQVKELTWLTLKSATRGSLCAGVRGSFGVRT